MLLTHQINSRMKLFRVHFIEPSRTLWIRTSLLVSYWHRNPQHGIALLLLVVVVVVLRGEFLACFRGGGISDSLLDSSSCVDGHMSRDSSSSCSSHSNIPTAAARHTHTHTKDV